VSQGSIRQHALDSLCEVVEHKSTLSLMLHFDAHVVLALYEGCHKCLSSLTSLGDAHRFGEISFSRL
jgi:hypothetical protein